MKTIELNPASSDVAKLLDSASEDDVILRLADGREFLLLAVDDFGHELAAQRGNEMLMKVLDSRAKSTNVVGLSDVKKRLGI